MFCTHCGKPLKDGDKVCKNCGEKVRSGKISNMIPDDVVDKTKDALNKAKAEKKKIVCVGTTSLRTIESSADESGFLKKKEGNTDIFIHPGYTFKFVDSLFTNFHTPESTLLMLVSAMAGKENIFRAYKHAIEEEYHFFSYGDAMFIKS